MSLLSLKLLAMTKGKTFVRFSRVKVFVLLLILLPTITLTEHLLNSYLQKWLLISPASSSTMVFAQSLRPEEVSAQVYQLMPDLPKENNYINSETKQIDTNNTLVARLVRYHQYISARPTIFRLDWKLTLADYMRKNEIIKENRYPGYSSLTQNPLEKDRQVITNLTPQQRNQLVNILVSIYNPNYQQKNQNSVEKNDNLQEEKPTTSPSFILPKKREADLLK
jgi:hypothetical protein